jgi:3-deoxy-7-phosphoheptulonate synthase
LSLLAEAGKAFDIPVITEIINPGDVDLVSRFVDVLQIGSRNMQNTALLKAVGKCRKPVLLKRGFSNDVNEWLAAAEYIMAEGNEQVILCERGIRTFEPSTRFSLDILSIPVVKRLSHLPIILDPSHAAGDRALVPAVAKAAIAAGVDGLMIEVNSNPDKALVDGEQCLTSGQFAALMPQLEAVARSVGREL